MKYLNKNKLIQLTGGSFIPFPAPWLEKALRKSKKPKYTKNDVNHIKQEMISLSSFM